MLRVLARAQAHGGRTRTGLAVLSGLAHKGGTYANYLSILHTRGLAVRQQDDTWVITPEGLREVGTTDGAQSPGSILALWRRELLARPL